ncbi:MAG: amphi-Trp domain-containing protein [Pseudomonadota bacterium]
MQEDKNSFRHESLQDADTIQGILKSVTKGIAKGKLTFSEEGGEITLEPEGLLNLKLTATKEEGRHRLTIRITWQVEEAKKTKKSLKVG